MSNLFLLLAKLNIFTFIILNKSKNSSKSKNSLLKHPNLAYDISKIQAKNLNQEWTDIIFIRKFRIGNEKTNIFFEVKIYLRIFSK